MKWTFYAVCFTQECMTNVKNPKSQSYNSLAVFQEILPAHWAVSILGSSLDSHLGTMDCLGLCSGNASQHRYQAKHM